MSADCPYAPPGSVLDTLYLAIEGFTTPIEGIEYRIQFPPEIMWIGYTEPDLGLRIGDPENGISMAFFDPVNAYDWIIIQELIVLWLCNGCTTTNIPIEITVHPSTSFLRVVTSDLVFEDVTGYTSIICGGCVGCWAAEAAATLPRAVPSDYQSEECVLDCPAGDGGAVLPGGLPGEHHSVDWDGDGCVNITDFAMFASIYISSFDPLMDFYCSNNIDLIDFVLFTRHWLHSWTIPVESNTWGHIKALYQR